MNDNRANWPIGMDESPFFFPVAEQEIFGILHRPALARSGLGFVFCHPFAEEKLWAHRVYVSLARDLTARGHTVLRFDHRGHGDSDGEFQDTAVDTHLQDIEAAVGRLRALAPDARHVALLGLRLGATFAALAAERLPGIDRLILWDPVVDGGRYMQDVLRSNLTSQLAAYGKVLQDRKALVESLHQGKPINVDGYELGHALYEQVSAIDLLSGSHAFGGDVLIVQVGDPGQPADKSLLALKARYRRARLELCVEEPFWREIKPFYARAERLSIATLAWLDGPCRVRGEALG
jgi:exosortase A-associated hydrolase 2